MTIFALIAFYLAGALLAIQIFTCAIGAWRCRRRSPMEPPRNAPPITLVRPLCGLESHSRETLEACFLIDYPNYELIFCVARGDDPIVPLVRNHMENYPQIPARLLIGEDLISNNPKLNNMAKGWRSARSDRIVFADSNLLTPRDYLSRLETLWDRKTGLVSAPPIGAPADDFGSELECAFLNSYEARWQYLVDAFGFGFAQGKTLFYRSSLVPDGVESLAREPAEDAASTKIIREAGLRVKLARPPFVQPLGRRTIKDVWSRQLRWSRLRRATFPLLFAPEILTGFLPPLLCLIVYSSVYGWSPFALTAYALVWYGSEAMINVVSGWPLSWKSAPAFLLRDLLIPALWIISLSGTHFEWKGQALHAKPNASARRRPRAAIRSKSMRGKNRAGVPVIFGDAYEEFIARLPSAGRASARVASAVRRFRQSGNIFR